MVSARIEICDVEEGKAKYYVLFYVVDGFEPTPIAIDNELYYDKIITIKKLIKQKGGANLIKREILLGNVKYRNGVYLV